MKLAYFDGEMDEAARVGLIRRFLCTTAVVRGGEMDEAARVGLIHTVRAERDAGIAGEMDEAARVGLIHTVIEQGQTRYVRRNGGGGPCGFDTNNGKITSIAVSMAKWMRRPVWVGYDEGKVAPGDSSGAKWMRRPVWVGYHILRTARELTILGGRNGGGGPCGFDTSYWPPH